MLINSHGLRDQLYCTYISTQLYILLWVWSFPLKWCLLVWSRDMTQTCCSRSLCSHRVETLESFTSPLQPQLTASSAEFSLTAAHHSTLAQETQSGMESYTLHHLSGMCKQSEKLDLIKGRIRKPPWVKPKGMSISHYIYVWTWDLHNQLQICPSVTHLAFIYSC